MTDSIVVGELRMERLLDAPMDRVWQFLVDPALRATWLMGGPTDLRPGGHIGFTMLHDNLSDDPSVEVPERYRKNIGHSWSEEIVRVDPPRLLAFKWDGGKSGEVEFTLTSEGDRTRLVMHHTGIPTRDGTQNFGGGWYSHLATLERRIRGEPVPSFWALHAASEKIVTDALASAEA